MQRVRNYSVYIGGKRIASATGSEYAIENGNEPVYADGEIIAFWEGIPRCTLTLHAIVPFFAGTTLRILEALLSSEWVTLGLRQVEGRHHIFRAQCVKVAYSSQSANGTLTGSYDFVGEKPTLIRGTSDDASA